MYHCHVQFYLLGRDRALFDAIRAMPPLEHFTHAFFESEEPDAALCGRADVVVADVRGTDAFAVLNKVLTAGRKDGELILVAGREQFGELDRFLPLVQELWLDPARSEIPFRFLRWQQGFRLSKDLWEKEQYLNAAMNGVPNLVWFKDKNGIHERVNDSFCLTVKKTHEQIHGRGHAYIWDVEADDPACIESEREVMETRRTCVAEESINTGEGKRLLTTYKSPLYDVDGSVMGTVGVAIDITQERALHDELVRRSRMLESLFTTMDCGVLTHTLDGKHVLNANRAALSILGFSTVEEMMAAGFDMVSPTVAEEDQPRLRAAIRSLRAEGDTVGIAYRVCQPSGKILHIMGNVKLTRENGVPVYQRFLLDCTAQKEREQQELREQERHQMELIQALSTDYSLVCFFNLDTGHGSLLRMTDGEEGAYRAAFATAKSYQESMDIYTERYVWPEDKEMFRRACSLERLREELEQKDSFTVNYRVTAGDAAAYYQLRTVRAGAWDDHRDVVLGIRNVDDATREELEQKNFLREALSQANRANEAKSAFLSNMSHDIRTPMNAIIGFTALLDKEAGSPEKVREYTRKISASGQHLLGLINDVLDMSKIESGKTSLNLAPFSLPGLMEELYTILLPQARAKGQSFDFQVHGRPAEQLLGDKLHLNQILINLLSNAIKYTPDGGEISMLVDALTPITPQYAHLCFVVRDNGIGMSEKFLKTVFDPFSREMNSTTSGIQGTGLGMAITKNLVELMGGTIGVESRQGEGTTFTVELSFALPVQPDEENFWSRRGISRILVADDDEQVGLDIREMMDGTGVEVACVTDGPSAVEAVTRAMENGSGFHAILIDWKMPGQRGVETARMLRSVVGPDVPILVLTAYDWSDIQDEALTAGVNAFMPKPFFVSTFRQVMDSLGRAQNANPAQPPEDILKGMFFLVAEDNELNAEILSEMLDMEGAGCEVASNGELAVEQFLKAAPDRYDMILMDVQMPVMGGYEATRRIRSSGHPRAADIPIVAMTANAFAEDVRHALDAGMNGHLSKPINMDAMRELLGRLKTR